MCKVLEFGSSSYYKWKVKSISNRTHRKKEIKQQITDIYFASKQRYGSPRINTMGYKISRRTVAKYLKELGLRSKLSKKFANTIESYGAIRSMSRKGNYWVNAVAESFSNH